MANFKKKKLFEKKKNLGEIIKEEREKRFLSINRVSKDLGIKKNYLDAIENNRINILPEGLYSKQFILKYCEYLNINISEFKDFFSKIDKEKKENDCFSYKKLSKKKFIIFPKIFRNLIFTLIIVLFFGYFVFYFINLSMPPELNIIYPGKDLIINEKKIILQGKTEKEAVIKINGEEIFNNDGDFSKEIILKKGVNKITISSKQKFSKENIINRQILLE
jgi:transcriptional regulator with XRE-family HTH domain